MAIGAMKADFKNTLLLAFEDDLIDAPKPGERWGFFNAQPLPANRVFASQLICEQSFRPEFLALEKSGQKTVPQFDPNPEFDHAIVFAGRVRQTNEQNFLRAWHSVLPGGKILVAGEKNTGIGSLRKWVGSLIPLTESLSKFHAVCFWVVKNTGNSMPLPALSERTGMFSGDGPDKGSELLARFFDNRIKGKVADFGAGWGYLSVMAAKACERIESIDLYEADWHALEFAKKEMAEMSSPKPGFHWCDITGEFRKKPFEWIIMNPPFHHGLHSNRAADPNLGKAFIQIAASTLVTGGRLLMVANRNLPYEETLSKAFRKHTKIADEAGYKVFEAVR